ncbi:MAG: cytidine deaminase [Kiritimatiellaceae bacterium TMED266]|jgi:dCMP deaminase|nr:MAG: cytidine deaminase [Kiritimatiellaceae bacterium TMED266]
MNKDTRPDWDTYFLEIARVVASRSNCTRRQVAAVIVKDQRIISTGYNGTPRGVTNCFEGGCPRAHSDAASGSELGNGICNHAEENAIIQAAYHGISVKDATLYCTLSPCLLCAKMIINAGIKSVIYENEYKLTSQTKELLNSVGIICRPRQTEVSS